MTRTAPFLLTARLALLLAAGAPASAAQTRLVIVGGGDRPPLARPASSRGRGSVGPRAGAPVGEW